MAAARRLGVMLVGVLVFARWAPAAETAPDAADSGARYRQALARQRLGQFSEAVRIARENIDLNPTHEASRGFVIDILALMGRTNLALRQAEAAARALPKSAPMHRRVAALHLARYRGGSGDRADLDAAVAAADRAIALAKDDTRVYVISAVAHRLLGRSAEAEKVLARGRAALPKDLSLMMAQGETAMLAGDLERARAAFEEARTADPRQSAPIFPLGMIAVAQGRPADAVDLFKPGTVIRGQEARHYLGLIVALHLAGRADEALTIAQAALKAHGADQAIEGAHFMILLGRGDARGADRALNDVVARHRQLGLAVSEHVVDHTRALIPLVKDDPDRARRLAREANLTTLYLVGRWPQAALKPARAALKEVPNSVSRRHAVFTCLSQMGRDGRDDAIAEAETLAKADPNWPGVHETLGGLYAQEKALDKAEASFREAVRLKPESAAPRLLLGGFLERHDKEDEALTQYEAAAAIDGLDDEPHLACQVYNNLAYLKAVHKKDVPAGLALAEKAHAIIERTPALMRQARLRGTILDTLGWVRHLAGREKEAVRALERANLLAPFNAVQTYHLGAAYLAAGQTDAARQRLEEALFLAPKGGFDGLDDAKRLLKSIRPSSE